MDFILLHLARLLLGLTPFWTPMLAAVIYAHRQTVLQVRILQQVHSPKWMSPLSFGRL